MNQEKKTEEGFVRLHDHESPIRQLIAQHLILDLCRLTWEYVQPWQTRIQVIEIVYGMLGAPCDSVDPLYMDVCIATEWPLPPFSNRIEPPDSKYLPWNAHQFQTWIRPLIPGLLDPYPFHCQMLLVRRMIFGTEHVALIAPREGSGNGVSIYMTGTMISYLSDLLNDTSRIRMVLHSRYPQEQQDMMRQIHDEFNFEPERRARILAKTDDQLFVHAPPWAEDEHFQNELLLEAHQRPT